MSTSTFQGIVENGQIRLSSDVRIPDQTKVYVIVPDDQDRAGAHIRSPRLVHAEQRSDFVKQVIEVKSDAAI